MTEITVDQLIKTVEDALEVVATKSESLGLVLKSTEVELSAGATWEGGVAFKFDWGVSIDLSTKHESSTKHVLSLSLTAKSGLLKLGARETDELASAILDLASAIKRAGKSKFAVTEGKVEVKFGITHDGKVKVAVGGGAKSEGLHSIKLTFYPELAVD
jgi:hypothetical protein